MTITTTTPLLTLAGTQDGSQNFNIVDVTIPAVRMSIAATTGNIGVKNSAPNYALDVAGCIGYRSGTLTLANGANQNVAIPAGIGTLVVAGPTAVFSVGGIAAGYDGQILRMVNNTAYVMSVNYADAGSTAANRIIDKSGGNVTLGTGGQAWYCFADFQYIGSLSRWLLVGRS